MLDPAAAVATVRDDGEDLAGAKVAIHADGTATLK
jgi:hypothetical protein